VIGVERKKERKPKDRIEKQEEERNSIGALEKCAGRED